VWILNYEPGTAHSDGTIGEKHYQLVEVAVAYTANQFYVEAAVDAMLMSRRLMTRSGSSYARSIINVSVDTNC
jgi:predicted outer membrane protein